MSEYKPNKWVVIKIKDQGKILYKVFGCWSGGYLDGDSWRLNSGIKEIEQNDTHFFFKGQSGSCYVCHKEMYGLTAYGHGILSDFMERYSDQIEMMPEDTDWSQLLETEN